MSQGATFKKFDLHLHAPGTGQCFTLGKQVDVSSIKGRAAFAEEYVRQARERAGLDAIAITNHNDVSWVDPIRQAARRLYKDQLVVFPGVEIGIYNAPSLHFVVLFEVDTEVDWIERFLDDIGLPDQTNRFSNDQVKPARKDLLSLFEMAEKRGGIVIAAHVCERNGLLHSSVRGSVKSDMFTDERLLAVEIPGSIEALDDFARYVITNSHRDKSWHRKRPLACLNSSDAKSLDQIGSRFTYVKCESPSLKALEGALRDPQARLRLRDDPPPEPACYISALRLPKQEGFNTTGFLRELELQFNPRLNCIIGARGAGKSAVIELLRYIWEMEPLRPKEQQGFADVFLPETGRAELEIVKGPTTYRLVREGRKQTRIARQESDGSWSDTALRPADLFQPQLYGQKEILDTSQRVSSQLELLDRFVGEALVKLKGERDTLLIELRRNREAIIAARERIRQTESQLKGKARIEEQLRQYHQLGIQELAGTKRLYDRETQLWEEALQQLQLSGKALEEARRRALPTKIALSDAELQALPNAEQLRWLRERMQRVTQDLTAIGETAEAKLAEARAEIERAQSVWEQERTAFEGQYRQALSVLPDSSPDGVLRLEHERAELERKEREIETFKRELQELFKKRRDHLRDLLENARQQYELRQEKAADISRRLQRIRVSVEPGRDEDWLRDLWERYLRGARLRTADYEALAQIPSASFLPLLALVEATEEPLAPDETLYREWLPPAEGNLFEPDAFTQLAQYCELDREKIKKLVERLNLEARLELDEMLSPDRVRIEMNIALTNEGQGQSADNKAIWRALGRRLGEGVSVGQGCTAILSILLLESTEPLIIDQPEDDLDNRFVYQEIVETLRAERGKRQMLFATHNPNIPVAGDAELIIALDVTQDNKDLHAHVLSCGFVDAPDVCEQVKSILEGGAAAFELRRMKYGF